MNSINEKSLQAHENVHRNQTSVSYTQAKCSQCSNLVGLNPYTRNGNTIFCCSCVGKNRKKKRQRRAVRKNR